MNSYPIEQFVKNDCNPINILLFIVDKCNLRCEYCYNRFPRTLQEIDTDILYKFVEDIEKKTNRYLNISLIGGEPTLHSKALDFCHNLQKIPKTTVEFLTNLSQSSEYYIDLLENGVKLAASWHGTKTDQQNKKYISNIMKIPYHFYENEQIEVRIMFENNNWESSMKVYNKLFPLYKKWIEISLLTNNSGGVYSYSDEQLKQYGRCVKDLRQLREFFTVKYSDGTEKQVCFNDMYLNPMVNFKLWKCNAGLDYIYVHVDGNVFNCQSYYEHGINPICNIYDTKGEFIKEKFKPCICCVDYCSCDFDIHKEKILKGYKK